MAYRRHASGLKQLILVVMVLAAWPMGCGSEPPAGEVIDFGVGKAFQPFELEDLEGKIQTLEEVSGTATLVNFFFPT